jgi:hypothetical protein
VEWRKTDTGQFFAALCGSLCALCGEENFNRKGREEGRRRAAKKFRQKLKVQRSRFKAQG